MNTQKEVYSTIKTKSGSTIQLKKCTRPTVQTKEIYTALNLKHKPYNIKKIRCTINAHFCFVMSLILEYYVIETASWVTQKSVVGYYRLPMDHIPTVLMWNVPIRVMTRSNLL